MSTVLPLTSRTHIGKYRIDGLLGHGGMGSVVLAYDPDVDRPVALKTIHAHLLDTEQTQEYLRRFRQEARAAARASHPNIVTVYEAGVDGDTPYLAMEYVAGRSLKTCLADRECFRPADAAAILLQVLEALAHAHAAGVVHRDIKPANILVLPNGTAKLTDFGVARLDTLHATQLGAVLGTPAYSAPEQRFGGEATPRSDLYAVGAVLAELVSGLRPDPADPAASLHRLRRGDSVAISPRFLDVLAQAMAEAPEARFATAAAMADALRHSLDDRTILELVSGLSPCRSARLDGLQDEPRAPPQRRSQADTSAHSAAPSAGGLTDSMLSRLELDSLEAQLTEYIGPLARILMRRYTKAAKNKADLVRCLLAHIHDPDARGRFVEDLRRTDARTAQTALDGTEGAAGEMGSLPGGGGVAANGVARGWDRSGARDRARGDPPVEPGRAHQLTAILAEQLGPLAKMLVRRAMQANPSEAELVAELVRHIPDAVARDAFLAAVRRR
jgi:serine/threonine-protein kinase